MTTVQESTSFISNEYQFSIPVILATAHLKEGDWENCFSLGRGGGRKPYSLAQSGSLVLFTFTEIFLFSLLLFLYPGNKHRSLFP